MLAVEQQAAARPQHATQLDERPGRVVDEGERAAAAHDGVEVRVRVRQRLDAAERQHGAGQPAAGDRQQPGRDVHAVRPPAELGE